LSQRITVSRLVDSQVRASASFFVVPLAVST